MRSLLAIVSISLALFFIPVTAHGQKEKNSSFDDAQAVVVINLEQFRTTELGKKIMEFAKEQAQEAIKEMGDAGDDAPEFEDFDEFLGFDPFEEVRGAVIAIKSIEAPEKDLVAIIQLGKTTGNIEGLLLGLPGYDSEKEDGVTIHSADFDGKKMYGAIHRQGDNKTIVIAPDKDRVINARKLAGDVGKLVGKTSSSDTAFLRVSVNELPADLLGDDGPQANISKFLEAIDLTIAEDGDDLQMKLSLTAVDSERAEQMRQMAQGLKAMVGFAIAQDKDDEDLKMVADLAKGIKVSAEENECHASLKVPVDLVLKFLREEADLPF